MLDGELVTTGLQDFHCLLVVYRPCLVVLVAVSDFKEFQCDHVVRFRNDDHLTDDSMTNVVLELVIWLLL